MVKKINANTLEVIKEYKDLRCIIDYARKNMIASVTVTGNADGSAEVSFQFVDCYFDTHFNSATIAENWVKSRRSWGTYDFNVDYPEPDYVKRCTFLY